MSLKEVSGDKQHQIIDAIFEGGWCRGEDLGDLRTLISLLEDRAIDGNYLSKQIAQPNVKQLLVDETNMAIDLGVFGVPCMIIDGLLFWGNDQMEHIELVLAGKDPLDKNKLDALERPRGIDRKTFSKLDKQSIRKQVLDVWCWDCLDSSICQRYTSEVKKSGESKKWEKGNATVRESSQRIW